MTTRRRAVYKRLQLGRATGWELQSAGGGNRFGARVKELRDLGVVIVGPLPWRRPDGTLFTETLPRSEDGFAQYELRGVQC